MSDEASFADFIRRIRAGDADAAVELVRRYESVVRLEVRVRLTDPRLGRVLESMDVCQSVLASFFVRAAAGQYDLEEPQDLVRLLVVMARKKLAFQARKERAQRRDNRRLAAVSPEMIEVAASSPSPSEEVAGRDLQRLSDEERDLADRRAQGLGWAEIAAAVGGTAQARRKQLERAIERVTRQLGLENDSDE